MVTVTVEQIERAERMLRHLPGAAGKAMARAMNRAIEGARTAAAKKVRERYRVKARDVKRTMKLRRATPQKLSAEVSSKGRKIPLFAFGPSPNKPGTGGKGRRPLRISVLKGKRRAKLRKAFVARKGSRLHVWIRTGRSRLPIKPLFGPAVPQMLGVKSVREHVERTAQERLDKRLDHEIHRALERG